MMISPGSGWDEIFSIENVESYSWAAVKLYEELIRLEENGFGTMVLPSRGTTPFHHLLNQIHIEYPKTRKHSSNIRHLLDKPFGNSTIQLPFTADPPEVAGNAPQPPGSAWIRDHCVRVLRAWLYGDLSDPSLRYYQHVLTNVFGVERTLGASVHRPSNKFVFVDTVVSGRAICEIVEGATSPRF